MEGTRKFWGFILTEVAMLIVFGIAKFGGVEFNGNDVTTILLLVAGVGGGFFGANTAEHFAKSKAALDGKAGDK